MKDPLLILVLCSAMGLLLFKVFIDAMMLPDVWVSYSTNECVKVLNYQETDKYSCENLPKKYNHVWVQ